MTPPVIPPAPRACSGAAPARPARAPGDGLPRGASTCTAAAPARRTLIPFGRDSAGMPVSWDLSAGRNLLIARDERLAPPSVALDLAAMNALSCGTHDVVVLDPHRRHGWLTGLDARQSAACLSAVTPAQMSRVVTELAAGVVVRPRLLLVADLAATVAALGAQSRVALTDLAVTARERQLTVVATTADTDPRWFPEHLIDAFDDIVAPQVGAGRYREPRLWMR